jgi:hypothetical protein
MVNNLTAKEILQFIIADFKGTWDSVAMNHNQNIGRGELYVWSTSNDSIGIYIKTLFYRSFWKISFQIFGGSL